ncbi:8-amino-7-oxononanoate synthase [Robiginitalea myxolifaciens]|uniref:8-amino-7-oxononanoate synthase n=1 Tax=Robiginitalea myxolifaciens TaxID=400055 RepID=A0A1I6G776_9FLAO|nr:aminotransferase class I/II-fold pyridoxal phosphate-dependent enzyme [Robiginitalea myxolifaciens]SFR38058.1 8-amino-7-oxononanoate synthase [Robiginitalea myxolifaciens]
MPYICFMAGFPEKLRAKLSQRQQDDMLRELQPDSRGIDFSSNDYLGFALDFPESPHNIPGDSNNARITRGSTSSRLIRGNHGEYPRTEAAIASFHNADAALVFNSGYSANLGLLASVPQRTDFILYDAQIHASLRDGIRLSPAKSYSFRHNDPEHLKERYKQLFPEGRPPESEVYLITESLFSMSGTVPDLGRFFNFCQEEDCRLILDEAHAIGVLGPQGKGLAAAMEREEACFARVVTFGKALGSHGAAILGSESLRQYLINFCRPLIYTTALPPASLIAIREAYELLASDTGQERVRQLRTAIDRFHHEAGALGLQDQFGGGQGAVFNFRVGGNTPTKALSKQLAAAGYDVRPILSPTVPEGEECLRFCVHSFNSPEEIQGVLTTLYSLSDTYVRN